MEWLEDLRLLVRRDPGAVVGDSQKDVVTRRVGAHLDAVRDRRELQRVLEQIDERMLDLGGIHADRRRIVRQQHVDAVVLRADRFEGSCDQPVHGPELTHRQRGARLES